MKTYQEIKETISQYAERVKVKLCTVDFAKGYCSGVLSEQTSESISEDEYNELSALVDYTFDTSEVNIPMKPLRRYACPSTMNHSWYNYSCPICGHQLDKINNPDKVERCSRCNQAIDWSGE